MPSLLKTHLTKKVSPVKSFHATTLSHPFTCTVFLSKSRINVFLKPLAVEEKCSPQLCLQRAKQVQLFQGFFASCFPGVPNGFNPALLPALVTCLCLAVPCSFVVGLL